MASLQDDLKNAATMVRKAGQESQTRLQNLQQMLDAAKREHDQMQQLINLTQSEIQNFEALAREFEKQAQTADEMQKRMQ